jgi:predicted nucleic acid-binding protein
VLDSPQRRFAALPVDDEVAASHGELAAAVVVAGRPPPMRALDLLIGATAHAHSARLYTRHAGDFVGLERYVEIVFV